MAPAVPSFLARPSYYIVPGRARRSGRMLSAACCQGHSPLGFHECTVRSFLRRSLCDVESPSLEEVVGSPDIWVAKFHAWSEARTTHAAGGELLADWGVPSAPRVLVQRNARRFNSAGRRRWQPAAPGAAVSPPAGFYIQCRQGGSTLVSPGYQSC